jgi:ATP-binding protein involved in chromosome partitioning
MAFFTPAELPDNKYYIFGKGGGQRLAAENNVAFLGEIPLVKSIADAGDNGMPVALDRDDPTADAFALLAGRVAQELSILANS